MKNGISRNVLLLGFGFYLNRDNGDKNFWLSLSKELSLMLDKLVIVSVNSLSVKFEREKNIYLYNVQSPFHRKKNNGKGLSFQFLMNSYPCRVLERSTALLKLIPFLKKLIKLHNIQVIHLMDNFGFLTGLVKLFFPNLKIYATAITYNTHKSPLNLYSLYQRVVFGEMDKVVVSSKAYKEKLIENGFSEEKLQVIRWGIPSPNGNAGSKKVYSPEKVILWTGFTQQIKKESFYLSVSLAKNILKKNPFVDFIFAFKPECFDKKYEYFRGEHIQVLTTKPENFQNLLPAVDLLLAPIDNYSSTVAPPLTWIECMSLGIPVISTPVPGVDEILIHNQTGFVAKSKQELEELIERVLEERDLLTKVSTRAKEWVRENYNLKDIAGDYLKLWREDGRVILSS
ncbi:MAG TPA: glycosyltransferase family 4 protein [candidate division Zixibacteria bacterium]